MTAHQATQIRDEHLGPLAKLSVEQREALECNNRLLQLGEMHRLVEAAIGLRGRFMLEVETIKRLQAIALAGLQPEPGKFRTSWVSIGGSTHNPPPWEDVPALMEEMCRDANADHSAEPVHLCAYTLWRLNWIHPFADGNGKTARAVAHLVLCARSGKRVLWPSSLPEEITRSIETKGRYLAALAHADCYYEIGQPNLEETRGLIYELIAAVSA